LGRDQPHMQLLHAMAANGEVILSGYGSHAQPAGNTAAIGFGCIGCAPRS